MRCQEKARNRTGIAIKKLSLRAICTIMRERYVKVVACPPPRLCWLVQFTLPAIDA